MAEAQLSKSEPGDDLASLDGRRIRHYLFALVLYLIVFTIFFSPVIFQGKLLAPGMDGLYNFLPYFYSKKVLWDPFVLGGFPMMADPTAMSWYPPAWIFSSLPGGWNLFVLFAYVAASFFSYGYVYSITSSRFCALFSGLVFGLSGFMVAHLGHTHIIQSAAWAPLLIWSLESQRKQFTRRAFIAGTAATAFVLLGGQPQIFFYALVLATAYLVVMGWALRPPMRRRYCFLMILMMALGVALAAIQILPTAELVRQTARSAYSFDAYVSYSLPPGQALSLVFPFLFGGPPQLGFTPYFGAVNQTEVTGYVGLLPLMLAAAALAQFRTRIVAFWSSVAGVAFLLALGEATPLATLIYHVPILNSFRAPARHFLEFSLAVTTLSGIGIATILQLNNRSKFAIKAAAFAFLVMVVCLIGLLANAGHIAELARNAGIAHMTFKPWANKAVSVPLIIFVLALLALVTWSLKPNSIPRRILLVVVLVVDLGSFGWFFEWRPSVLARSDIAAPAIDLRYRDLVASNHQRLMPVRGAAGLGKAVQPNLSRLWSVPSADGYNALIPQRTSRLLEINDLGDLGRPLSRIADTSLDLMAVRYLFLSPREYLNQAGAEWAKEDMQKWVGAGCEPSAQNRFTISLPIPARANALGVVSRSACSTGVADGLEIARVRLVDVNGQVQTQTIVEGRDTSEWAYDCEAVRAAVRHRRATVFSDFPSSMNGVPCAGHSYVSRLNFNPAFVKQIEFEAAQSAPISLIVEKLTLIDGPAQTSYPVDPALANSGLRFVEETRDARVFENPKALPRAWLVNDVRSVADPAEALATIKSGVLKEGLRFDPLHTALVEGSATTSFARDESASAAIVSFHDTQMVVRTSTRSPAFLVTSDSYYPGWQVRVDSNPTTLYQTDYAIRGVFVPAGEHFVQFDYRPRSVYAGAVISALALLILIGTISLPPLLRRREKDIPLFPNSA